MLNFSSYNFYFPIFYASYSIPYGTKLKTTSETGVVNLLVFLSFVLFIIIELKLNYNSLLLGRSHCRYPTKCRFPGSSYNYNY